MKTWRRFRALSARDRYLIVEAASLLFLTRTGLSILPFSLVRRVLCAVPQSSHPSSPDSAGRVAWAVMAAAGDFPMRTTCLVNALACEAMFKRRRWPCDLRFGVQLPIAHSNVLEAHSWIEYDGRVVLGAVENLDAYRVLSSENER